MKRVLLVLYIYITDQINAQTIEHTKTYITCIFKANLILSTLESFWCVRLNKLKGYQWASQLELQFVKSTLIKLKLLLDINYLVCFLLGDSLASDLYMPTFRNTLSVPSSKADVKWYINQTPGNHPKENKQHSEHGESLKSRLIIFIVDSLIITEWS